MNYIGSKHSLLKFLEDSIESVISEEDKNYSFCDIFAGTGAVGLFFKQKGHKVYSNDLQYYSYVLNRHHIGNSTPLTFEGLINIIPNLKNNQKNAAALVCSYLKNLDGIEGFIYKNYCPNGAENERLYFTAENGKKCDAIRTKVEEWKTNNLITSDEYFFLIASLLEAIDKTANTASVYGAFLKKFKGSALKPLDYKPLPLTLSDKNCEVSNENANDLIEKIEPDVLYMDPPYNARQYATNYHVLETIARYDNPTVYGKTGLRDYTSQKSLYCSKAKIKEAFSDLIKKSKSKYIFLSYNNEGLMSLDEIREIMSKKGDYRVFAKEYNRFKADSNRAYSSDKTTEYLHCVVAEK